MRNTIGAQAGTSRQSLECNGLPLEYLAFCSLKGKASHGISPKYLSKACEYGVHLPVNKVAQHNIEGHQDSLILENLAASMHPQSKAMLYEGHAVRSTILHSAGMMSQSNLPIYIQQG